MTLLLIVTLKLCSVFLLYNEARTGGYQLNDFVLKMIPPRDVSIPLFIVNWIGIIMGILITVRKPKGAMALFIAVMIIVVMRALSMFFVPLMPPEGIVPLRDPFLEFSFYGDKVLLRDLFFSGHTASLAVLYFFVDIKPAKYIIAVAGVIVGVLLLVSHVHYTIDIIAAPFFAYVAYLLGTKLSAKIASKFVPIEKVKAVLT
ncbi:MAG: hypothetical protein HKN51_06260 [Saprospiraceae bacterium]|nr:sphingomyelin synthase family protein [Bacteroidia bacterium]NNE14560.1 hypothetical protein [Saprospiraceae bacterium]